MGIDPRTEAGFLVAVNEQRRAAFLWVNVGFLALMPFLFWGDRFAGRAGTAQVIATEAMSFFVIHVAITVSSLVSALLWLFVFRRTREASRFERACQRYLVLALVGFGLALSVANQPGSGIILSYLVGLFLLAIFAYEPVAFVVGAALVSGAILLIAVLRLQPSVRIVVSNVTNLAVATVLFSICYPLLYRTRVRSFGLTRDLEERNLALEAARRELEDLNRLKSTVLQAVTHDLRTPLLGIRQAAWLLRDLDPGLLESLRAQMARELEGGLRQAELVLGNLTVISGDGASVPVTLSPLSSSDLFSLMVESFSATAERKRIALETDAADDFLALGNRSMVATVFRNLVSNGLKYTPAGGTVTMFAELEGNRVRFGVRDTGLGIAPALEARLRAGEWGLSTHGTAGEEGTGIGLMVSRSFLQRMGCSLDISSEPGRGSVFSFTLGRYSRSAPR